MAEKMPDFSKEREFHKGRWDKQAKKHEERGAISKLFGKGKEKTSSDFMREEAARDNEDYEKKLHKEYGEWERGCKVARERFLERARSPEQTNIKTVLVFPPGGMRAAGVAGAALALNEMGINSDTVDYVVGGSSGDVVGTRFVGGRDQLLRGIASLTGPLADKKFIDVLRPGNAINLGYNKELDESGEFALDTQAIQRAHSKLWTLVTEPMKDNEVPTVRILDKKALKEGIATGTVATMSIPWITGKIPTIDGTTYYDPGFAALPISQIIEKIKSEDPDFQKDPPPELNVLIFSQASFEPMKDMKPTSQEELAAKMLRGAAGTTRGLGSLDVARKVNQLAAGLVLKQKQRESLESIQKETRANIGVVWAPPSSLIMTSIDADEMKMAVSQSFRQTNDLFGIEQSEEVPQYVSEKERLHQAIKNFTEAA